MYPLGHFSVALATRDNSRNLFRLLFCCFLTILPDFDFLVGIEFVFCFNLLLLRETYDKFKDFLLNNKCPI